MRLLPALVLAAHHPAAVRGGEVDVDQQGGVRGHVDFDPGVTLGVTSDPIQPSSREPNYPASRDGVRGHVDN